MNKVEVDFAACPSLPRTRNHYRNQQSRTLPHPPELPSTRMTLLANSAGRRPQTVRSAGLSINIDRVSTIDARAIRHLYGRLTESKSQSPSSARQMQVPLGGSGSLLHTILVANGAPSGSTCSNHIDTQREKVALSPVISLEHGRAPAANRGRTRSGTTSFKRSRSKRSTDGPAR
jgi:hypothetical protein